MKFLAMIAAGLLGVVAVAPAPASAAVAPAPASSATSLVAGGILIGQERVIVRERTTTRRYNDRRGNRYNRGPRWGTRKVCKRTFYRGRKVTRCRTVRYRR